MNKIYEAYKSNKKYFYLLFFMYVEVISAFCTGIFSGVLSAEMTSPGNAGLIIVKLSPLGYCIVSSILIIGMLLLLIPVIWLTIKAVKDKLKTRYIFLIWICTLFASILGFILAFNGISLVGKVSELFIDFLNDKFDIFVSSYNFSM